MLHVHDARTDQWPSAASSKVPYPGDNAEWSKVVPASSVTLEKHMDVRVHDSPTLSHFLFNCMKDGSKRRKVQQVGATGELLKQTDTDPLVVIHGDDFTTKSVSKQIL